MVTIGIDAHKHVHQAVALDGAGRGWAAGAAPIRPQPWQQVLRWATSWTGPRQWGVEGAWNYGRGLAQCLVGQGETVYEINPNWTAKQRRRARTPGKSDRLDADAAAKLVHEEAQTLPPVTAEDESAILDLLVTEREAALAEATRLRNQLDQLLLQVDPAYATALPIHPGCGPRLQRVLNRHLVLVRRLPQRQQVRSTHRASLGVTRW